MADNTIAFSGEGAMRAMGRLVELLRQGVQRDPERLASWRSLGQLLCRLGRPDDALASLDEALVRFPADVELRATRIGALLQLKEEAAALAEARRLWRAEPQSELAGRTLLRALAAAELWDELEPAAATMAWVASDPKYSLEILARRALLVADEPADLLAHCERILARSPGHTNATYYRAIALARLGQAEAAREALGLERYLSISMLPAPEGQGADAAFHGALAAEIRANPTLMADPRPLCGGLQTFRLQQPGARAIPALLAQIEDAVAAYVAGLPRASTFAAAAPAAAELRSWAVIYGQGGWQKPHRHPGGWLSGVYYVSAALGEHGHLGALQVGAIDPALGIEPPWGVLSVEPIPGRLVLFPSYTPHATAPCGLAGERISVAFDVVAADQLTAGGPP